MQTVSIEEAKTRLPELVQDAVAGDDIVIAAANIPVVRLVPFQRAGFGSLQGQIQMADDFDAPLAAFDNYKPSNVNSACSAFGSGIHPFDDMRCD